MRVIVHYMMDSCFLVLMFVLCFQVIEIVRNVGIATVAYKTGSLMMNRSLNMPNGSQGNFLVLCFIFKIQKYPFLSNKIF